MRKRLLISLLLLLVCTALGAQTPRAVLKAIYKSDDHSQVEEKYTKAVRGNPDGDAGMRLMRAAYLNFIGSPVDAYYVYCKDRSAIESDAEVLKMLKSLQLRLTDIFSSIESSSSREILRLDTVEAYDRYIEVARENLHPALDVLCTARENRAFSDATAERTVAACDTFLVRYPNATARHLASVKGLRADLRYAEASSSSDEEFIEAFLSEYPSYSRNAELRDYLSDLRYNRVTSSGTPEDLKWFCSLYPDHPGTARVRKTLSELEYETLDKTSVPAVRAYLAQYPEAGHFAELRKWADFTEMMQTADLATIFAYIEDFGYDSDYPAMVRAIASVHGALVLTPDITEVDLVRFRDSRGRVGYWDKKGAVAVAPRYEMFEDACGYFAFDAVFAPEFVKGRGAAAVRQNGKAGAIDSRGNVLVALKGVQISVTDEIDLMLSLDENRWIEQYSSEKYSLSGAFLGSDVFMVQPEKAPCSRRAGFNRSVAAAPKAGRLNSLANVSLGGDDYRHVLTRDGIALLLEAKECSGRMCAYTDRYISTDKGIVDASNWSVLGPDPGDDHEFIKEGRILVCRGGLWGYLDENLSTVVQPAYKSAESFCGGAAMVQDASGCALIDRDGAVIFRADEMERLPLGSAARAEWEHYALYLFRTAEGCGVVDSGACVLLEPSATDGITISSEGFLESTRAGRTHKYDLTELIAKAAKK